MALINKLRPEASGAPVSGIEAVMIHGRNFKDVLPLWFGEGDQATPDFISRPASEALLRGETFYTWQNGIPELREALARYHTRHFGKAFSANNFVVTIGGMHAIRLALEAVAGAGDELVYLTPSWPNINVAASINGMNPVPVPLARDNGKWVCDMARLEQAITPKTRAIFVNSPSNPTGWVADRATLKAILDLARQHGLWIIADEIYALFHYAGGRAPSFHDVMEPEDQVLFVNSFSKNWAMTGWRVGWLGTHPSLSRTFENLIQYSTSGVAQFIQRGAAAALDHGDDFIMDQVKRAKANRDMLCNMLVQTNRVNIQAPDGAFYLFFSIDGVKNSHESAMKIVEEARVGLAPGDAFGEAGEGYFRLCFMRDQNHLREAATRLTKWISSRA